MSHWDELYRENILDHYKHPRHHGKLESPDISYEDANPLCGDVLRMDFKLKEGRIDPLALVTHRFALADAPNPPAPPSAVNAELAIATTRYPLMRLMLRSSLSVNELSSSMTPKRAGSSVRLS